MPPWGGAALLDLCQAVTGQAWLAEPMGDGFRLMSWLHGASHCLTVNEGEVKHIARGVPYMTACEAGGTVFAAVTAEHGQDSSHGFLLKFVMEERSGGSTPLCLSATEGAVTDRFRPVLARDCDGAPDQVWTIAGGHLSAGVPLADRVTDQPVAEAEREPSSASVEFAQCMWSDGTTDRPDYHACRIERDTDRNRIDVIGPDYAYSFNIDPDRPDSAQGLLRVGKTTLETGTFRRMTDDISCWTNGRSGERLCIW